MNTKVGVLINVLSPRCNNGISCLMPDGRLNTERWRYFCKSVALDSGVMEGFESNAFIRVFPWLGIDRVIFKNEPLEGNMDHYPWPFKNGKFLLTEENEIFYNSVYLLFKIAKEEGISVQWVCGDRCHGNSEDRVPETPMFMNHNGVVGFFDKKARPFIKDYLQKVIDIVKINNFPVLWELFNEPRGSHEEIASFTMFVLELLLNNNIPISKIESGVERFLYNSKENRLVDSMDFEGWERRMKIHGMERFNDNRKQGGGKATLHNISRPDLLHDRDSHFKGLFSHTRGMALKTDGYGVTGTWWMKTFLPFLREESKQKMRAWVDFWFEGIFEGKDNPRGCDIHEIKSMVQCFSQFSGEWVCGGPPRQNDLVDPGLNPVDPGPLPPPGQPVRPYPPEQPVQPDRLVPPVQPKAKLFKKFDMIMAVVVLLAAIGFIFVKPLVKVAISAVFLVGSFPFRKKWRWWYVTGMLGLFGLLSTLVLMNWIVILAIWAGAATIFIFSMKFKWRFK